MVVDSSALVAILLGEPEAARFIAAIANAPVRLLGTPNALECAIVLLARKGPAGVRELDLFVQRAGIDLVPFTAEHLAVAREAYERFGRGRHAAGLNFGDSCAYALAVNSGEALLWKGDDFGRTDVAAAG